MKHVKLTVDIGYDGKNGVTGVIGMLQVDMSHWLLLPVTFNFVTETLTLKTRHKC